MNSTRGAAGGNRKKRMTMKKTLIFFLLALLAAPLWGQKASDYRAAAERGDARSQYALGRCYEWGMGTSVDEKQAFFWVNKAALQGFDDAAGTLGSYYLFGTGTTKNTEKAIYWLKKSATTKAFTSQVRGSSKLLLALIYLGPAGGFGNADPNLNKVAYWAELAANDTTLEKEKRETAQGLFELLKSEGYTPFESDLSPNNPNSETPTATPYTTSTPTKTSASTSSSPQSTSTTSSTGTTSSSTPKPKQVSAAELFAQADNYRYGRNGVVKNAQKAVELYTQAANMGDAEAQLSLGYCYYMGEGVSENCQKAHEWLKKAEAKKHTLSAARQQLLETTLANTAACAQPQKTTQSYTPTYSQPSSRKTRNKYGSWPWYYDGISHGIHFAYIQRAILGREAGSGASGHYDIFGNEGWSKGFQFGFHFNPMGKKEIIGMNTGFYMEFLFDRWKGAPSDYYDAYAEMNLHVPLEMVLYLPLKPWKSALHLRAGLGADFSCFGQLIAWDDSYSPNLDVTYGSDFINRFNLSLNLGISLHYDKWMFHATWQKGLLRHPYAPGYRCTLDKLSLGMSYLLD